MILPYQCENCFHEFNDTNDLDVECPKCRDSNVDIDWRKKKYIDSFVINRE